MEDFKPTGDPRGPLVKATDWIKYSENAERETNTMPQWAGSCWYYLRYCDPNNVDRFISKEAEEYWSSDGATVDLYVGGTEHAVLHLLYARFWHKVMFDLGHLTTNEPFKKLVNQGLILGEDGQKMSKSLGNVVSPDEVVDQYGADSLRLYEMFMGPLTQVKPWQMKGVEGVSRFLAKVWRVAMTQSGDDTWKLSDKITDDAPTNKSLLKVTHETIKKVTEDIEKMSFNTAISQMMICTNAFTKADKIPAVLIRDFLKCLNPFAPHITEEIHQHLSEVCPSAKCSTGRILSDRGWPSYKEEFLVESEVTVVIQVNGKLRSKLTVAKDISKEDMEALALADENVKQFTDGNTIRKVIVVPGKLVNIVAN
jgi:leucyl-tRNA synthetase